MDMACTVKTQPTHHLVQCGHPGLQTGTAIRHRRRPLAYRLPTLGSAGAAWRGQLLISQAAAADQMVKTPAGLLLLIPLLLLAIPVAMMFVMRRRERSVDSY